MPGATASEGPVNLGNYLAQRSKYLPGKLLAVCAASHFEQFIADLPLGLIHRFSSVRPYIRTSIFFEA
jgi:hypothetical protein